MTRLWIAIAGLGGSLSVAAGALAAHLPAGESKAAPLLSTAAHYGLVHAASLVAVAAIAQRRERRSKALAAAGWGFSGGIFLFTGSLLALALTGIRAFAFITPFGGAAMLFGWAALAFAAFESARR